MISKLRGYINELHSDTLDLDVNDVIYEINCSKRLLEKLLHHDQDTKILFYIQMVVREDAQILYGFSTLHEKKCFQILTSVQGVGNRVGLALMSIADPERLATVINAQDKSFITQAEGVGPKLASRIVNELKDKITGIFHDLPNLSAVSTFETTSTTQQTQTQSSQILHDGVSALVNLGFRVNDAEKAARSVLNDHPNVTVNDLIRQSLGILSNRQTGTR